MTFYSVEDRPAEEALRNLPKAYEFVAPVARPSVVQSGRWGDLITADQQPVVITGTLTFENSGDAPYVYTVAVEQGMDLVPTINGNSTAEVVAGESVEVSFTVSATGLSVGTYTGRVTADAAPPPDVGIEPEGLPAQFEFTVAVADEIEATFLPVVRRDE